MKSPDFLILPDLLVRKDLIEYVDISNMEKGEIIVYFKNKHKVVNGVMAIEILMTLRPSALEGKRFKWAKNKWIVHNLLAHPIMQILALCGLYSIAMKIHDYTVPTPINFKE